ncbi:hypothetical protein TRFO_26255 [Tritrichomonas foetus]|uniref:TNase-like domain-containing protein n=1 Tax=Tritrichomonas foetus TaxID=1144522 RepID=A0A1J4K3E5_9EUKA|nr:hypothetical protein TRFO_26255 [Tritrichomonas foetus]|eukprot:OHT05895.1 hypothetical protein TRFO_26255 [Tritrichomonas foetus]
MSGSENSSAYVLAVLTGDTLLVRYCDQSNKYGVILLPVACAPQFPMFLNTAVNDPFAIESLNFLREHIENKRVLIGPQIDLPSASQSNSQNKKSSNKFSSDVIKTFTHQTLGQIPVCVNSVRLIDDLNEDLDAFLIQNGFARIRKNSPIQNQQWMNRYEQLQEAAYINKLGIWGNPNPPIDPSVSNEFESVIISINSDFTFRLLEPAIDVEIAGITKIGRSSNRSDEFNRFLGERILFHKVNVRVLQRSINSPPIVSMSIRNFDLATLLLQNHFVTINEITSHFLNEEQELRRISKIKNKCDHEFQGKVTKILSSCSFIIADPKSGDDERKIVLAYINIPKFDFSTNFEKGGIEAFRILRNKILNQIVNVDVVIDNDGEIYGTVKVSGVNLNIFMVKEGYATISKSRIMGLSPYFNELKHAYDSASSNKLGIHSIDTNNNNSNISSGSKIGIIHEILSPTELSIFVDDSLKNYSLQGLKTTDFCVFHTFQAIMELQHKFLYKDVEIQTDLTILELSSKEDIRATLLVHGYAISSVKFTQQPLINAENTANSKKFGIFDSFPKIELNSFKTNKNVIVSRVLSLTRFILQFQSEIMSQIQTSLIQAQLQKFDAKPKSREMYIINVNGKLYRGRVNNVSSHYILVDYGFVFPVAVGEFYNCPQTISKIPPQAVFVELNDCLPFTSETSSIKSDSECLFDDIDEYSEFNDIATKFIWNFFDQKCIFEVKVETFRGVVPQVNLFDPTQNGNLISFFVQDGLVKLNKRNDTALAKLEDEAKEKGVGGWAIRAK